MALLAIPVGSEITGFPEVTAAILLMVKLLALMTRRDVWRRFSLALLYQCVNRGAPNEISESFGESYDGE